MFTFLKKFLDWADEGSRKRRAPDNDIFSTPSSKKSRCCHHHHNNNSNSYSTNHREVLEVEDPSSFSHPQIFSTNTNLIYRNNFTQKSHHQNSSLNFPSKPFSTPKSKSFFAPLKMGSSQSKARRNSQLNLSRRSTLSKSNQLIQKQRYSEILQSYCVPRIQLIPSTPNGRVCPSTKPEVIDVEEDSPPPSSSRSPNDVFKTPMSRTPTKYFTPMTRPPTSSSTLRPRPRDMVIPVIQVTDEDEEEQQQPTTPSQLKKVVANRSVEVITTNTLRDSLSAKKVLKPDFVHRATGFFKESMEQLARAAEQLKREAELLASNNRHRRMASLGEQLAKTMEQCKPFLEDEEEEEEDTLPELTKAMIKVVKDSLEPSPGNQILVEKFDIRITRKDICTLSGLNWLNDEIINFYMNLIVERGKEENFPSVHAMSTFFYEKLKKGGHSSVKRWTKKIDIFSKELVLVPIHLGVHWCMAIIDFRDKSIRYYDSMGGSDNDCLIKLENQKCLEKLREYLVAESLDKKNIVFDTSNWTLKNMKDIPQQGNGSDCGVFSCTFAEFICANRKIFFTQDNMPYFRQKMVYEIVTKRLL